MYLLEEYWLSFSLCSSHFSSLLQNPFNLNCQSNLSKKSQLKKLGLNNLLFALLQLTWHDANFSLLFFILEKLLYAEVYYNFELKCSLLPQCLENFFVIKIWVLINCLFQAFASYLHLLLQSINQTYSSLHFLLLLNFSCSLFKSFSLIFIKLVWAFPYPDTFSSVILFPHQDQLHEYCMIFQLAETLQDHYLLKFPPASEEIIIKLRLM